MVSTHVSKNKNKSLARCGPVQLQSSPQEADWSTSGQPRLHSKIFQKVKDKPLKYKLKTQLYPSYQSLWHLTKIPVTGRLEFLEMLPYLSHQGQALQSLFPLSPTSHCPPFYWSNVCPNHPFTSEPPSSLGHPSGSGNGVLWELFSIPLWTHLHVLTRKVVFHRSRGNF